MISVPAARFSADIGVFGGSGFYEFLDGCEQVEVDTPYGPPAEAPVVGSIGDRRVAFIPRHGADHRFPPHMVPYRANAWAMAALGVRAVIGPFACGSLRREMAPGHVVLVDQLVDRTSGRELTFYDGPSIHHLAFADPYDPAVAAILASVAEAQGLTVHRGGTVVVIPGPRFSTRAESRSFAVAGFDLVNMTQAPEVPLCGELGLPYTGIGLVTDYDVGLEGVDGIQPVTETEVFAVFDANIASLRKLLSAAIARL